jgi:hypothetical protein
MRFRKLPVLLFFIAFIGIAKGQQPILSIDTNALNAIGSVCHLDSSVISVPVTVTNSGTATLYGAIYIDYSIGAQTFSGPDTSGKSFLYPVVPDTLFPAQSTIIGMMFTPGSARIAAGPSVVVIWPRAANAITADSARKTVLFATLSSVYEADKNEVQIYISGQDIVVKNTSENLLKHVRIFDLQGNLLTERDLQLNALIPINKYAAGIYLAEVTFADNSRKAFKVFKTAEQ